MFIFSRYLVLVFYVFRPINVPVLYILKYIRTISFYIYNMHVYVYECGSRSKKIYIWNRKNMYVTSYMVVSWTKWERRIGKEGGKKYRDMIFYIINLYIHKGSHIKCVYVYIYIYVDIFVWVITYADMFVVFLCFSCFI